MAGSTVPSGDGRKRTAYGLDLGRWLELRGPHSAVATCLDIGGTIELEHGAIVRAPRTGETMRVESVAGDCIIVTRAIRPGQWPSAMVDGEQLYLPEPTGDR